MGWEKGTGKKWGKSKKKGGTDLSLEEMKKQAAVQCLRSASDEVSIVPADCCNPVILIMFEEWSNDASSIFCDVKESLS